MGIVKKNKNPGKPRKTTEENQAGVTGLRKKKVG
jgi:hypothetical protein